ncbi:MAG: DUF2461 domain-containing protein [Cyclobacteriaceae bacterium]|nr:DUF2461 domain-containing protein [Cyclobacteriaceae bacterium]
MSQITTSAFQYLKKLKTNNNREWFKDNKKEYEEARAQFVDFIDTLIGEITTFDPTIGHHSAKECVFRIYRDVRFSKDKAPYKTHFGAHITSAEKRSDIHTRAGYYIHIEPGASMLAGGAYLPQGDWLKAIRSEIDYNAKGLKAILDNTDFKKYFGEINGEKLKTAPRDYPKDHPEIELLKHKSFLASHSCSDQQVTSEGFLQHSIQVFKALYPFDRYLNDANT